MIEGQGALHHPSFAGVTLGLIHGAQPDALVVCHEPTRTHMRGLPHYPVPEVEAAMEAPVPAWRDAVLRAIADGDLDRGREVLAAAIESGASDAELAQWADLIERLEPLDRSAWVP